MQDINYMDEIFEVQIKLRALLLSDKTRLYELRHVQYMYIQRCQPVGMKIHIKAQNDQTGNIGQFLFENETSKL